MSCVLCVFLILTSFAGIDSYYKCLTAQWTEVIKEVHTRYTPYERLLVITLSSISCIKDKKQLQENTKCDWHNYHMGLHRTCPNAGWSGLNGVGHAEIVTKGQYHEGSCHRASTGKTPPQWDTQVSFPQQTYLRYVRFSIMKSLLSYQFKYLLKPFRSDLELLEEKS